MLGKDTEKKERVTCHKILTQITNVEPFSIDHLKDLCSHLSNDQLKEAYIDCHQHKMVIQNITTKGFYTKRCQQLIGIMVERIKQKESHFKQFCEEQPDLANHLVTCFLGNSTFLAKVIDHNEWFNWLSKDFITKVEHAIITLPNQYSSKKINTIKLYSQFCKDTLDVKHWYSWLERISTNLLPEVFFDLLGQLDPSQKCSILFLNQLSQDTQDLWQTFFETLNDTQLSASDNLYRFIHIAQRKRVPNLIRSCYAKAVAQQEPTIIKLTHLFKTLLSPSLPSSSFLWIESIIIELFHQNKLNGKLLIWLITELTNLNFSTSQSSAALLKAVELYTQQFVKHHSNHWPENPDANIAYQILSRFDVLKIVVGEPTMLSRWSYWYLSKNKQLQLIIDKLDINKYQLKIIDQWLLQGCDNWEQLIYNIQAIQNINNENGHILLASFTKRLQLKSENQLTTALYSKQIRKSIYQHFFSPLRIVDKITNDKLSLLFPLKIEGWNKNLSDIIYNIKIEELPKLLKTLPADTNLIAKFWQHPKVQKINALLLMHALKLNDAKAEICLAWWIKQDKVCQNKLLNSLFLSQENAIFSIKSLIYLSQLISHFSSSVKEVSGLVQNWFNACVRSVSHPEKILSYQWDELEHTITTMLPMLMKVKKLSPQITAQLPFTTLIQAQIAFTKKASIAVNLSQQYPSIQLSGKVKHNRYFYQSLTTIIANMPESQTKQKLMLFNLLPQEQQQKLSKTLLSKPGWVIEYFGFSCFLINFVDVNFIYQQIKKTQDPRPYIDLIVKKPYKMGLGKLNLPQCEQIFHNIKDRAHLIRLLQSDSGSKNKYQFFTKLLDYLIVCDDLNNFINKLHPDLCCLLIMLNYTNQKKLQDLIHHNQSWRNKIHNWLINPKPHINLRVNSLLYKMVVESVCQNSGDHSRSIELIGQSDDSLITLCYLLRQSKCDMTDTWLLIFSKYQNDYTKLALLVSHTPIDVLIGLLEYENLPYNLFLKVIIDDLKNNARSFNPSLLIQSMRKNLWPIEACLEGLANSKNLKLNACLSLYCLTLSDYSMLEGPTTTQVLANNTKYHALSWFSQSIQTNLVDEKEYKLVSKSGALALLMDPNHFGNLTDKMFQILSEKTNSNNFYLIQRLLLYQINHTNAKLRLRKWHQFYPELTLSSIENLTEEQQTSLWLQLVDSLLPSLIDSSIINRLPNDDPIVYIYICKRAFNITNNQNPLLKWLRNQSPTILPSLLIKQPSLVHMAMLLTKDKRFNPTVVNFNKLANSILFTKKTNDDCQSKFFKATLNEIKYADGQLISILMRHNSDAVLTALGKSVKNYSHLSNVLKQASFYLSGHPDIKAKADLMHKQAELEHFIKKMHGPIKNLRAWFLRVWHSIWIGSSPFIPPPNDDKSEIFLASPLIRSPFANLPSPFNRFINTHKMLKTSSKNSPFPKIKKKLSNHKKICANCDRLIENQISSDPCEGTNPPVSNSKPISILS